MSDLEDRVVALTVDNLRCSRKNGDWHCSERRLNGRKYCDKHRKFENVDDANSSSKLFRFHKKSSEEAEEADNAEGLRSSDSALRCTRRNGDWKCSELRFEGGEYCNKHSKFELLHKPKSFSKPFRFLRSLSIEPEVEEEEDEADGQMKTQTQTASVEVVESEGDEMRCGKMIGRGRPRKPRLGPQNICEAHYRMSSSWEEENEEVKLRTIPEDELRCKRNDGRGWRCKNPRILFHNFCHDHYLRRLFYSKVSAPKARKKGKDKSSSMKRNRQASSINGEEELVEEELRTMKRRKEVQKSEVFQKSYGPGNYCRVGTESDMKILTRERITDAVNVEYEVPEKEEELVDLSMSDSVTRVKSGRGDENNACPGEIQFKRKISSLAKKQEEPNSDATLKGKNTARSASQVPSMCHQCQRSDKGKVVTCKNCRTKRYCVRCMTKWLILISIFSSPAALELPLPGFYFRLFVS